MKRIHAPWRSVYLEKGPESDCVFCDIHKSGEDEKNRVLFRGDFHYVVVNAYPYSNGHLMVVCNRHVENFHHLDEGECAELPKLISRCEKAILDTYKPGGINVGVNLGKSAGAGIIGHLHVHLVPRWDGDTNFMTALGETRVIPEDLDDTYKRLKKHFG